MFAAGQPILATDIDIEQVHGVVFGVIAAIAIQAEPGLPVRRAKGIKKVGIFVVFDVGISAFNLPTIAQVVDHFSKGLRLFGNPARPVRGSTGAAVDTDLRAIAVQ